MNSPSQHRRSLLGADLSQTHLHSIQLSYDTYKDILSHCAAALPNEACGLLIGAGTSAVAAQEGINDTSEELSAAVASNLELHASRTSNASCIITSSRAIPNVHPAPRHAFAFDPSAWTTALYDLHRTGQQLIGYYHSHPTTPPIPSQSDLQGLILTEAAILLIVSLASDEQELKAYRACEKNRFKEVSYQILDAES